MVRKIFFWNSLATITYKISSPTAITEAVSVLFLCKSSLFKPLLRVCNFADAEEEYFFALPALSNLPSWSKYAGLNFSPLLVESLTHNNSLGTVSWMLPIEVYLQYNEFKRMFELICHLCYRSPKTKKNKYRIWLQL